MPGLLLSLPRVKRQGGPERARPLCAVDAATGRPSQRKFGCVGYFVLQVDVRVTVTMCRATSSRGRRHYSQMGPLMGWGARMIEDASGRDAKREACGGPLREAAYRRFVLGRAAWQGLALSFDGFADYFRPHAASATLPAEGHAADMYLACACALEVGGALAAFERVFSADMMRAVASIHSSPAFVDETMQTVRQRLFVRRDGEPGKIASYAGRASLKSWLCAVAVRSAISVRRRKGDQRHKPFAADEDRRIAKGGPEFEYLRGRYKAVFESAVRTAIERLPAKQRLLLRLNLVDGMTIDNLGTAYKVGRSTAARWLADARRALFEQARLDLQATLRLTSTELDSLAVDLRSQLEVSVLRLLERGPDECDKR
jgi:RNA polymerase sigma-70 factor (ECF subfamily)